MTGHTRLAHIERLNAALLNSNSATLTLDQWCSRSGGPALQIVSERLPVEAKALDEKQRALLQIETDGEADYRRVRLCYGGHVVSVADNWYVPSRLNDPIIQQLTGDISFGRAIKPLGVRRVTLSSEVIWPVPDPDIAGGPVPILRHQAIVLLPDDRPISLVRECYMDTLLMLGDV